MDLMYETDWLGTSTVYYNEKTFKASSNINDVIEHGNFEFDPEGLRYFLDYGYSAFGLTPVRHVKYLEANSILRIKEGCIHIDKKTDQATNWIDKITNERVLVEYIESLVRKFEKDAQEVVVPLSGGYDSRLICCLLKNKDKANAFTYGLSAQQAESFEVVYAKEVASRLGINWKWIFLDKIHDFFDKWYSLYGPATHAHGMYHLNFYANIRKDFKYKCHFISGIIGDAWSGKVFIEPINNVEDMNKLFYSHGLCADSRYCKIKGSADRRDNFYEINKKLLQNPSMRIVESMRAKLQLLSYLLKVPAYFDFRPYGPFLDITAAMGMLQLPPERRKNRIWQMDIFRKFGVDLEKKPPAADHVNLSDIMAQITNPLQPLNTEMLSEIIEKDYVDMVNALLSKLLRLVANGKTQLDIPKYIYAYNAYLTLYPIQRLIQKRNET